MTDALGYPVGFILTPGQAADSPQAEGLLPDQEVGALIADKAYDTDSLLAQLSERGIEAVIPLRKNRTVAREYDRDRYKERHLIECFFGKIKYYRRIFSRFEKRAHNYLAFLHFVAALIWMR